MIAERGGGRNRKGTRTGKFHNREVDGVTRKIIYLLTADPRFEDLPPGRRVALTDSTETLQYLTGDDPERYAEHFTAELEQWNQNMRGERKASQNLCIDRSFSFAPDDPVDPDMAMDIVQHLIERVMGEGKRLALYAVHTDKPHLHVHVIASVVDIDGKIFNPHNDDDGWAAAMTELEPLYGLRQVDHSTRRSPKPSSGLPRKPTKSTSTSRSPAKAALRMKVEQAVSDAQGDFPQFLAALDQHDIQLVCRQREEGIGPLIVGVSFYHDGETFTGSQLAPQLAWPVLRTRVGYRDDLHHALVCQRTRSHQADRAVSCTMKAAPDGSSRADVIELPARKLDRRKQALLASMQREAISSATVAYRWRSGADCAFREIDPAGRVKASAKAKTGMAHYWSKQPPRLTTENGMNRKVIRCMLVRACQLGWRRVVIEGSKAFVKLAKALCQHWLKGVVHPPQVQSQRISSSAATAVGETPLSTPAPQPPSRRREQPPPARVRVEKREEPAPLREVPSRVEVIERAVTRDAIERVAEQGGESLQGELADRKAARVETLMGVVEIPVAEQPSTPDECAAQERIAPARLKRTPLTKSLETKTRTIPSDVSSPDF